MLKKRCKLANALETLSANVLSQDRLVRIIGTGTSGTVWETLDSAKNSSVAVKIFHEGDRGGRTSQGVLDIVHMLSSRPEASAR